MTSSGERGALDPDSVPLHLRVRALHLRHPDGPLPSSAIKTLRGDAARFRPGSRKLIPDRPGRGKASIIAGRDDRKAARAVLQDLIRAAASGSTEDLDRLCGQLRGIQYHWGLRFEDKDAGLGLEPESIRAIALHLLECGVTQLEIMTGLDLLTTVVRDDDVELLREIALLQCDYGYAVTKLLLACSNAGRSLYWLAVRSSHRDRIIFTDALGKLPAADAEALLEELDDAASMALLRMMSFQSHTPAWIKGNRAIAIALARAAKQPELFGSGLPGLVAIAQVRDDLLYGHSALLDLKAMSRASVARDLLAALRSSSASALLAGALALDPHASEPAWLHRYVERADDGDGEFPPGLTIRIAVPAPSTGQEVRTHLLVDGVPLVARLFDMGVPSSPERLLHPQRGLRAQAEPHEVWLAVADCDEGCCGALAARVHRDEATGVVCWEVTATRARADSERFSFDADEYEAEIARAEHDRSWEWPARRAARLLNQRLRNEPALLETWACRSGGAHSWSSDRSVLRCFLWHPEPPNPDRPWLQFEFRAELPDAASVGDDAAALVEDIIEQFRATDPKTIGRLCGGSQAYAEALGFQWPPTH